MRGNRLLKRNIQSAVLVGAISAMGATAFGSNWVGGNSTGTDSFNDALNWSPNGIPSGVTDANINQAPAASISSGAAPNNLNIGSTGGASGILNITGGTVGLRAAFNVGLLGTGVVNQSGGTVNYGTVGGDLNIGTASSGSGTYAMSGSAVLNPSHNINIGGGGGTGTGLMTLAGGTPINLGGAVATMTIGVGGTLRGYGTIVTGSNAGTFVIDGSVIADGGTLTLPTNGSNNVVTSHDTNSSGGVFATNGGSVVSTSGFVGNFTNTSTYTAFDNRTDTVPYMTNAVTYVLRNQYGGIGNNKCTTSILDPASVSIPALATVASVWNLSYNGSLTGSDLTFRYPSTIISSQTPVLYQSTDGGTTWTKDTTGVSFNASLNTLTLLNAGFAYQNGATEKFAIGVAAPPPPPAWAGGTVGDFNVAANWTPVGVPASGGEADFLSGTYATNPLVYTQVPITLGKIVFNNANASYELVGAVGTSLTMQPSSGSALVDVRAGTHEINMPLTIASNTTIQVADGTNLIVANPVTINAGKSLSTTKVGTLLNGTVTYQSTVTVGVGGSFSMAGSAYLPSLTLQANAAASVATGATHSTNLLQLDSLSMASGATLSLNNNGVIVHGGSVAAINTDVMNGSITGNTTDPSGRTALGVADASTVGLVGATYGSATLKAGDVLVRPTYFGDANLDGVVNGADYTRIDGGYGNATLTGWMNGDFNYDGTVDGSDYSLIDGSFGAALSAFPAAQIASAASEIASPAATVAVPEPTTLCLLAVGATALLSRRTRRRD